MQDECVFHKVDYSSFGCERGSITETKYDELYSKFRAEQKIVENKLGQLTQADDSYYMTLGYLGDLSRRARELFESSRADEKRRLLTFVLSNLKLKGKKVLYEAKKPFDMFLLANDRLSWGRVREVVRNLSATYLYSPSI